MSVPICAVDCETDGIHPDRKPWEIALIRRSENTDGDRVASFFVEIDLSTADPFGLKVGGFYDRHPVGQWLSGRSVDVERPQSSDVGVLKTPAAAAGIVARWTHGAHIIGAVPNFDTHVFDRLLRDHGLIPSHHYHLVDVENLAVGFLAGQGNPIQPPWKSDALSEALGLDPIPEDERHTALGDAKWALRIYDRVMSGKQS